MPAALSLKKMTALHMQARNILIQRGGQLFVPTFPDWQLSFVSVDDAAPQTQEEIWMLEGTWAGALFYAYVPAPLFTHWLQNWIPQNTMELPALPEQLLAAVVDGFATQMIDALSRLNKGRLRLNTVRRLSDHQYPPAPFWVSCLFQHTKKQEQFYLFLAMDELGLMVLAQQMKIRPLLTNGIDYSFLSLPVFFCIGTTTISARRLGRAKLHDVLLFDRVWLDHKGRIFVVVSQGMGFWAVWQDNRLVVDSSLTVGIEDYIPPTRKGQMMADTKDEEEEFDEDDEEWDEDEDEDEDDEDDEGRLPASKPTSASRSASLSQVDVSVLFDIGEKTMTLQELGQIHKGQVFDLGRPLRRSVALRVHGAVIAEGELVEVDGHLGVMIHHLVSDRSS